MHNSSECAQELKEANTITAEWDLIDMNSYCYRVHSISVQYILELGLNCNGGDHKFKQAAYRLKWSADMKGWIITSWK